MMQHLPLRKKKTVADELPVADDDSGSGAFALQYWEETRHTASPNGSTPVHAWTVKYVANPSLDSNIDAVIRPKGFGGIATAVADATSVGGDKRGLFAVDLQLIRGAANQVAAADYSHIGGGYANRIDSSNTYAGILSGSQCWIIDDGGSYSAIAGGSQAKISGSLSQYCFIGAGTVCEINSTAGGDTSYSAIGSGSESNIESTANGGAAYSFIGAGALNEVKPIDNGVSTTSDANYSAIGAGNNNRIERYGSFIGAGEYNTVNGIRGGILNGKGGFARITGAQAHGVGGLVIDATVDATVLCAQRGNYVLSSGTSDATPAVMMSDDSGLVPSYGGVYNQIILPSNSSFGFRAMVTARDLTLNTAGPGDTKVFEAKGAIRRLGAVGTTAMVAAATIATVANDAGAAAWTVAFTADATLGALAITVTGEVDKSIAWVAHVETVEIVGDS